MDFKVLSRRQAKQYSFIPHQERSAIVSIYSSDDLPNAIGRNPKNNIKYVLPIMFDDVGPNDPFHMEPEDAEKIRDFILQVKDRVDRIIVHCDAGVSRSAGVCAAIEKYLTGSDMRVFDDPSKCPNMHCYRLMLDAFFAEAE